MTLAAPRPASRQDEGNDRHDLADGPARATAVGCETRSLYHYDDGHQPEQRPVVPGPLARRQGQEQQGDDERPARNVHHPAAKSRAPGDERGDAEQHEEDEEAVQDGSKLERVVVATELVAVREVLSGDPPDHPCVVQAPGEIAVECEQDETERRGSRREHADGDPALGTEPAHPVIGGGRHGKQRCDCDEAHLVAGDGKRHRDGDDAERSERWPEREAERCDQNREREHGDKGLRSQRHAPRRRCDEKRAGKRHAHAIRSACLLERQGESHADEYPSCEQCHDRCHPA